MKGTNFKARFSISIFSLFMSAVMFMMLFMIDEGMGDAGFTAMPFHVTAILLSFFGFFAVYLAYLLLRAFWFPAPERLILDDISVEYDMGFPQLDYSELETTSHTGFWEPFYIRREKFIFPATSLSTVELLPGDQRNSLTINHDSRRIEFAKNISDAEREWLFSALKYKYAFIP